MIAATEATEIEGAVDGEERQSLSSSAAIRLRSAPTYSINNCKAAGSIFLCLDAR